MTLFDELVVLDDGAPLLPELPVDNIAAEPQPFREAVEPLAPVRHGVNRAARFQVVDNAAEISRG
ncbi:hypothetical protein [Paraburkholderia xenovorans]|uniref:Uncharacterized protein n=1 Tax=Paraburkholderia xenovorans (strain LB400) TaxID=266265 RepID=Q13FW7_PARXL|nr:hypothetical protein [Paraburkholderia xenovorans]ABE37022.1 hypothetical protein Bxe_C1158 [Paraburkholderia xenovorans LB400]